MGLDILTLHCRFREVGTFNFGLTDEKIYIHYINDPNGPWDSFHIRVPSTLLGYQPQLKKFDGLKMSRNHLELVLKNMINPIHFDPITFCQQGRESKTYEVVFTIIEYENTIFEWGKSFFNISEIATLFGEEYEQ